MDRRRDWRGAREPYASQAAKPKRRLKSARSKSDWSVRAVFAGAVAIGAITGVASALTADNTVAAYSEPLTDCRVTDGDTIRCGDERIRLLAIDAPEKPGACRRGRNCAPGDPVASTESLRSAMVGPLRINRVGNDRYGRTLGAVSGAKGDLSCWQLERQQAINKADWDNGLVIARTCPRSIL